MLKNTGSSFPGVSLATAAAVILWAYWSTLGEMAERWSTDPQYSHGFLVPGFAAYLLWRGRDQLAAGGFVPRWWGLGLVLAGAAARLTAMFVYQPWLDAVSLVVVLIGTAGAAGGRRAVAWVAPAALFLVFMIPLPFSLQSMLGGRLQRVATLGSTYALQTLGVPAVAEGNVILLTEERDRLGVVEACNGLSMMMTFFAITTAVALLAPRGRLEKLVLLASAVPISVLANVTRITATGLLIEAGHRELAERVFHDLAGWLMMPLAIGLLALELGFLGRALVPVGPAARGRAPAAGRPGVAPHPAG